jgi:uncharacterized membrane protein required for colicin V production
MLDILLGLVILLFVPFGIRRGVAKEAMVSAGLLLGAILAGRFAESWGAELASRFAMDPGVARFVVSVALLLAGVFLLGYGAGAALGVMRVGTLSRLAGGLLAAFNAALFLSYVLRWIDEYLAAGAALDDGFIGEALLRRSDSLLLGAATVLLALTILGWIFNATRARRQPRELNGAGQSGIPARQRPVRVAPAADAGKYEPGIEPAARSAVSPQGSTRRPRSRREHHTRTRVRGRAKETRCWPAMATAARPSLTAPGNKRSARRSRISTIPCGPRGAPKGATNRMPARSQPASGRSPPRWASPMMSAARSAMLASVRETFSAPNAGRLFKIRTDNQ